MLVRSPVSNIMGLHLQDNKDPKRIIDVGAKNYTVLDGDSIMPYIRENINDAVFCYRLMQVDPIDWSAAKHNARGQAHKALAVFERKDNFGRPLMTSRDFFTPGNEMNLALEKGNNPINMQTIYQEIGQWSWEFADEWNKLGHPCGIVSPALSPGHSEDQEDEPGIIGYEIMKDSWSPYDLIGVHCYWLAVGSPSLTDKDGLAKYYAFRNVDTYRKWWPNHDCWEGEWNTGGWVYDTSLWQPYANECDWYLRELAKRPWVRAATHFIFDSWDQPYQISKAEPVYRRFVSIGHEYIESSSAPQEPPPIIVPPTRPIDPTTIGQDLRVFMGGKEATLNQAQQKYPGLTVKDGADVVVSLLTEVSGVVMCHAVGPADTFVELYPTNDGPGSTNARGSNGFAEVEYTHDSQAQAADAVGPWTAACGGAKISGLGMAWLTNHDHFNIVFMKRQAPVVVPPVIPPALDPHWDDQRAAPEWQMARIVNHEDHRDVNAFKAHLTALGVEDPNDTKRYGWMT